uniref:N-acetylgalactosaminide beta-1,3-galactosyltransferase n=1 Tax=Parastrongyloides trichosuri TaxID=131310 RepID=A0A0N4Z208_PARTI
MDFNEKSITCSICLDILYDPVNIECDHCFCKYCIQYAINLNDHCPICRQKIVNDPIFNLVIKKFIIDSIEKGLIKDISLKEYEENTLERRYKLSMMEQGMIALYEILRFSNNSFILEHLKYIWQLFQNISKELYNNVKIFCIVLTKPEHRTRVNALRATWLKRCNKYKHIVTGKTKKNKKGKRQTVYTPIKNILITTIKQLQKEYTNEIDWFLFVDDTSYVVMENLRYMLYKYNPEE